MNWDRIAGNWTQWKGRIEERWGRLSHDLVIDDEDFNSTQDNRG